MNGEPALVLEVSKTLRDDALGVVARVEEARDWARITRIDGRRTVTLEANVDPRQANAEAIVNDQRAHWLPASRLDPARYGASGE